jgi:uncharacterized membrane protein YgdD (TMEM256/DUF423 family)
MGMRIIAVAGALGFLGVALGAFGAHGLETSLKEAVDGAKRLAWWHTAVQYQLWHALLLLAVGLWRRLDAAAPARLLNAAGVLVVVGVALFSGSLYAMTLSGITKLGMVTPLGGLAFLGAWACVAAAALRGPPRSPDGVSR